MLLLSLVMVCSCQTAREVTLPNGATYRDSGHLAGDTIVYMDPDGTVILRNKMNKPWQDFLQAAGLAYAANRGAAVDIARSANRTATTIAAGRQATAVRAIEAKETVELGAQATERFLHPPPLP